MLEMLLAGRKAVSPLLPGETGPGPTDLVGSYQRNDKQIAGFYGEVTGATFGIANLNQLATAVPKSSGIGTNYNQPTNWLKFLLDGKILFICKTQPKYMITWKQLYEAGLIYGTDDNGLFVPTGVTATNQLTLATVNGYVYRVRVIRGINANTIARAANAYSGAETAGSEWNRLFYNIMTATPADGYQEGTKWASYGSASLNMSSGLAGYGRTICQECNIATPSSPGIVARAGGTSDEAQNISWINTNFGVSNGSSNQLGWRPVFELVGKA